MAYCSSCGRVVNKFAKFCESCGVELVNPGSDREYSSQRRMDDDSKVEKECEYCRDPVSGRVTGIDPGNGDVMTGPCPVCRRRKFNLVRRGAIRCVECGGTGRVDITERFDVCANFRPHRMCGGTGWV